MVMKVGYINPVLFKSSQNVTKPEEKQIQHPQIKELPNITPDFAVQVPQKYQTLGVEELPNGLKLHSYKLANGHRVTIIPMEGSPAIVKNYVNVGSMNETDDIKGISHFLEHMAFNGTTGENGYIKLNQGDSFNKIDKLGGWTNASTNYAVTDYVNSTPLLEEKDLEEQIKIIAGMTEDLALTPEMIEKEKGPVCSEINMIMDNPQTILMDQTVRSLFNIKSSADELVGGSTKHIKNLTREKVKAYYDKYYTPDNMNLVITGDVNPQKTIELVSKNFRSNRTRQGQVYDEKFSPITKTVRKDFITDKASATEIMFGFAGPKVNDTKANIIYDIIQEHLFSTSFGLKEHLRNLNANYSMSYEKVSTNKNNPSLIFVTANSAEENSEKTIKLLWDKISNLSAPTESELERIKTKLIQARQTDLQYSNYVNNITGLTILDNDIDYLTKHDEILNSITTQDIEEFIKEYLSTQKAAITVVHPTTTIDSINQNYTNAKNISFKGKRQPLATQDITETKLNNNFETAFLKSKNDNIYFSVNMYFPINKNINPATKNVLDIIYSMGTIDKDKNVCDKLKENNNIEFNFNLSEDELCIKGFSTKNNFNQTVQLANEVLNRPRITQEEFDKAIEKLKDYISRSQDSAIGLYIDEESKINPHYTSKGDILNGLETLTLQDVQDLHNYIIQNASGTIAVNIPESSPEFKEVAIEEFEKLNPVKAMNKKPQDVYIQNDEVKILTKEKNVSQADIMQLYKFPVSNNPKERAISAIANTLLSSSSSIGLFNTLREKEHLAYSVYSDIDRIGNCGEISCHILTTTDNKDIGEISYDNVQKSINGFHRQINALKNSQYSDEDLESAKRILKANLLQKEGIPSKLNGIINGQKNELGIDLHNQIFSEIDNITRADIDNFTQKAFQNPPIYSIVASKDTLENNKGFLESLKTRA